MKRRKVKIKKISALILMCTLLVEQTVWAQKETVNLQEIQEEIIQEDSEQQNIESGNTSRNNSENSGNEKVQVTEEVTKADLENTSGNDDALNQIDGFETISENSDKVIFDGGTGTSEDPYLISTIDQLRAVNDNLDASFKLCNDLDLAGEENWIPIGGNFVPIEINSQEEFTEVGKTYGDRYYYDITEGGYTRTTSYIDEITSYFYLTAFQGNFDGANHIIKNVTLTGGDEWYFGFFGFIDGDDLKIQNLHLQNLNLQYDASHYIYYDDEDPKSYTLRSIYIGGIAGYADSASSRPMEINNCTVDGSIIVYDSYWPTVGGIGGGYINTNQCMNNANIYVKSTTVKSNIECGGISGRNGKHTEDVNFGSVTVEGHDAKCGGIMGGKAGSPSVSQSVNFGNISAKTGMIVNIYGNTYSGHYGGAGGIAGDAGNTSQCINYGNINTELVEQNAKNYGYVEAGGIFSDISGISGATKVSDCYNLGNEIKALRYDENNGSASAYRIGEGSKIENCYSANDVTYGGNDNNEENAEKYNYNGIGITREKLKEQDTYNGFDFDTVWSIDSDHNGGFPYLKWTKDLVGVGVGEGADNLSYTYNGHSYEIINSSMTWTETKAYCERRGGYLATITSEEEQKFINSILPSGTKNLYWIGLSEENEEWSWIIEETFEYQNWAEGEPNNDYSGTETVAQIYGQDYENSKIGEWNDALVDGGTTDFYLLINTGFICEYNIAVLDHVVAMTPECNYEYADLTMLKCILDFDQEINLTGTGYAYLIKYDTDEVVEKLQLSNDNYKTLVGYDSDNILRNRLSISFNYQYLTENTLIKNTEYYILIDADAIEFWDYSTNTSLGEIFEGIHNKNIWHFKTASTEYPKYSNFCADDNGIDYSLYRILWGPISAYNIKKNTADGKNGHCNGLVYSVGAWLEKYEAIRSIGANANTLMELDKDDTGISSYSFLKYIQLAQIYQYTSDFENEFLNVNGNHLKELYQAIFNYQNGTGNPIILGIKDGDYGHALMPLGIISENSEKIEIAVYDCSGSEIEIVDKGDQGIFIRTLVLKKDSNGSIVSWSYHDKSGEDENAYISFVYIDDTLDSIVSLDAAEQESANLITSTKRLINNALTEIISLDESSESAKGESAHLYWSDNTSFIYSAIDSNEYSQISITDGYRELISNIPLNAELEMDIATNTISIDFADLCEFNVVYRWADENDNFSALEIAGYGNGTFYSEERTDGILINSNTLTDITISTSDNNETEEITFTSNKESVLISEDNGETVVLEDTDGDGNYETTIARVEEQNPFEDVNESDYYYDAVMWAYSNGITSGITPTTFRPESTCTRAQVVTFIWRAMGEPEPGSESNPFTDIKASEYYYDAVLWAYQNGIVNGVTNTTFCPDTMVTRAQVVTFLWRAEGQPSTTIDNPFTDVKSNEYYYDAVLWAYDNGITSGATETLFKPTASCTRAQVVTFLYRDMH